MPEGAVYCGRPSPFGNPYCSKDRLRNIALYRQFIEGVKVLADGSRMMGESYTTERKFAIKLWAKIMDLRGKDLACWCALDMPCHVDILLEVANG